MAALHSTTHARMVIAQWPPFFWKEGLLLMLKIRSLSSLIPSPLTIWILQRFGRTSLHWSSLNGHEAVVSLLLKRRASLNHQETVCCTRSLALTLLAHSPSHRILGSLPFTMHPSGVMMQWSPFSWGWGLTGRSKTRQTSSPLFDSPLTGRQDSVGSGQRAGETSLRNPPPGTSTAAAGRDSPPHYP
jgi:hypothetical protein